MKECDILIIGAGAAGLMAAYAAGISGSGKSVTVLEKMSRPGRKIMITGKGRCNFTNVKPWEAFQEHVHPNARFLRPAFFNLPPEKLTGLFAEKGMPSVVERGERAFPADHKAVSVVDCLCRMAEDAGAKIVCDCAVTAVLRSNRAGFRFQVNCSDGSSWACRRLIITTGGKSYPRTGSSGDGYAWASAFGHSITPLFPSLCALTPRNYEYAGEWISLKNVSLSSIIDGNEAQSSFGDLDFTDGGIEGPLGFRLSRKCVKALCNGSRVSLVLDLKPAVEEAELSARIQGLWKEIQGDPRSKGKSHGFKTRILLGKLMPQEAIDLFLKYFPEPSPGNLASALKHWKIDIASYVGFERCVVTAGGVELSEVNPKTLESKLEKGLHLAGEVLDLDADTGGYNLHIAFCSGYLAGACAANAED